MRARLFCLLLAGIALSASLRADTWRRTDAEDLLKRWCDALVARQVTNSADAKLNGGILCPACMFLHGRIADLSYPLAHLYAKTGDRRYLDAATKAVDFVEANLVGADGRVYNDVKHTWWGITVFSQVAFCKALLAYGERLPPDVRARWTAICRRETDFMLAFFEKPDFRPNVNYPVAYCEAMVLAGRLFDEPKYTAAGRDKAHALTAAFVAEDGLLVGEGHPSDAVSPRGCRFVDLGYNMEESLDALAEVADALRDETLAARVERSALAHLAFMLPDGGLDNSVGSRSAKWTYYGSRTSDGLLPILGFLARRGHPEAVRAIRLHLGLLRRCTLANGLLAGGLMHAEADEPACAHHAFAHAKSLVDLIRSATPETAQDALLPREKAVGQTHYPTLDADLVACGPWRATFTANDMYSQRPGTSVSGGSLSFLYHLGLGPVLVGTMSVYTLVEPANMQDQRHDDATVTFTPRLVSGKAVSCADWKAKTACTYDNGVCTYAAEGSLADDASRSEPRRSRDTFRHVFRLDEKGLRIEATSSAATWQYRLPVIATPHDVVTVEGCRATIRRDAGTIRLTASKPLRLVGTRRGERIWTPVAGLLAADFALDAAAGETVTLNLAVE